MEWLTAGNGGWVRYESDDLEPAVFARLSDDGGRLALTELYLSTDGGPGLSVDALRRVPVGRIETLANGDDLVRSRLDLPCPDLRTAVSYFATTFGGQGRRHWARDMIESQIPASPTPKAPRERDPRPPAAVPPLSPKHLRLDRPASRPYGEDFYRRFAEVYRMAARQSRNPAELIADANGIESTTTVHRWVRMARKHGFLPRAHQGKAG